MRRRTHLTAAFGYVLLALGVAWPLPLHLTTRLPGAPAGDTGVYVWNLWIFRHELLRHGQFPLFTDHIFALTKGLDLAAHNYTIFADVIGLALIPLVGVVGAFNIIYLLLIAGTAYATFLLVRKLTGAALEAWIAGAAFAASPVLVARGSAHFSLVAAMPLPLFLLCLLRLLETRRTRDAVLTGVVAGWAGYCDVYFPIYCALMAVIVLAAHKWRVERRPRRAGLRHAAGALTTMIVLLGGLIGWRLWTGHPSLTLFGHAISLLTLYTPVLLLTLLILARAQVAIGLTFRRREAGTLTWRSLATLIGIASAAGAVILSPVLIALVQRVIDGRLPNTPIYWRSSPAGLDLVELFMPNPNHPWFGAGMREWITASRADAFPEFVGSLSLIALAIVAIAAWKMRGAIPRLWMGFTGAFALLALGPFIQIGRVNTYVPGPWALLRYVPLVELARAPSRLIIVADLGLSICLAFALVAIRQSGTGHRRVTIAALGVLLALELLPAPRQLYDAAVPSVYAVIRADADESRRVLELPVGVRDGTSSMGDFNASIQYYQTVHRKPLIGGYVSRVSDLRKLAYKKMPVLSALMAMSEGTPVPEDLTRQLLANRREFVARSCIGYVVIDRERTSPALRSFAAELFDLVPVGEDRGRQLYLVSSVPPAGTCDTPD